MSIRGDRFRRRIDSIQIQIESLSALQKIVALPSQYDITKRQWFILESQLSTVKAQILSQVKKAARKYLARVDNLEIARHLNSVLGKVELELSRTFTFFDTYMDVLTQRHTPELGALLAGCDVLALDAIKKNHPALDAIEPPLVYCDRGFGASILREGVYLSGNARNPMPLVQIPYSRLKEKYNLTSVLHEVGHEVMIRLNLMTVLPDAFRSALTKAGAPEKVRELFALWFSEIGPDFWAFCASGPAQSAGIRDILALPPEHVFRVSWTDPHPPPYLRALLAFEWCRQVWGKWMWDEWEKEWLDIYPLEKVPPNTRKLLICTKQYLPIVAETLLYKKFRVLNNKTIPSLFDLSPLAPAELTRIARTADSGTIQLRRLSPSVHLAVFRILREQGKLKEETIDKIMTQWLIKLGEGRDFVR